MGSSSKFTVAAIVVSSKGAKEKKNNDSFIHMEHDSNSMWQIEDFFSFKNKIILNHSKDYM